VAVDPYLPVGKVPTDEHDVPLVVMAPLVGIAMVPVTPVGSGLDPGVVISVDPSGIPVGPIPSGEVAPSEGIAESGSVSGSSTWANAGLAKSNGQAAATINKGLVKDLPIRVDGLRSESIGRHQKSGQTGSLSAGRTAVRESHWSLRLQTASPRRASMSISF
jgi:hypothetical protein